MKKIISSLLLLFLFASALTGAAFAANDEDITDKFTDPNFLAAILEIVDTNSDSRITKAEVEAITVLQIWGDYFDSFDGLEYFTNVEDFHLSAYDSANTLDVSHMTNLAYLNCSSSSLTELIVSGCTKLEFLYCSFNNLQTLDISGLSNLSYLNVSSNPISSIDVSSCPSLERLIIENTKITELNLTKNPELISLSAYSSPIESLDISKNAKLQYLNVAYGNLTSLDISKNPALTSLRISENPISSLDISKHTNLTTLYCLNTRITSLDLSKHTKLGYLQVGSDTLTELVLPSSDALLQLLIYWDGLRELDLSKYPNLNSFVCNGGQIKALDLSAHSALWRVHCSNMGLEELILPQSAPRLRELYLSGNNLTHLDLSRFEGLEEIDCRRNNIASISDVSIPENAELYWFSYYPQNIAQNDGWNRFSDISRSNWFYDDIKFMVTSGLVPQSLEMDFLLSSQSYEPQKFVTRGELVESLFAAVGYPYEFELWNFKFNDVADSSQFFATTWAAHHGIIKGIDETHFAPNAPITRQDLATILVRFVQYMEIDLPKNENSTFTDEDKISDYALENVKILAASGIIKGMDDGSFAPRENVSRAQIAALLHRLLTL